MRKLVLALALAVAPWATSALAEDGMKNEGFFLRIAPGVGAFKTKFTDDVNEEIAFKGVGGSGDVAIGYSFGNNLMVHGTIFGSSVFSPKVEVDGVELGEATDVSLSLVAFGGGATYYIGDSNFYLTGSLGFGKLTADANGETSRTKNGLAYEIAAGKEWEVGERWGVGVGAGFTGHSIPLEDFPNTNSTGTSFDVRFTASMN